MTFDDIIGEISDIEIIARGLGVDARQMLNRRYGRGDWRKLKGLAEVKYHDGSIWLVEVHWYQAHGIGRRDPKDKHKIRRLG
ncbi:MAG: hypothetical protein DYG89_13075 [Caldilinea sp. CFX5]|nr:hypothetical protein [Caldilinea sp. CFX5]